MVSDLAVMRDLEFRVHWAALAVYLVSRSDLDSLPLSFNFRVLVLETVCWKAKSDRNN